MQNLYSGADVFLSCLVIGAGEEGQKRNVATDTLRIQSLQVGFQHLGNSMTALHR